MSDKMVNSSACGIKVKVLLSNNTRRFDGQTKSSVDARQFAGRVTRNKK